MALRVRATLLRVFEAPRSTVTVAEGSSPIHWVVTVPSSAASAGSAVAGAAVAGRQRARSPVGFRSGRRVGRRSVDRRTSLPDGVVSRTGSPDLSVTRVLLGPTATLTVRPRQWSAVAWTPLSWGGRLGSSRSPPARQRNPV